MTTKAEQRIKIAIDSLHRPNAIPISSVRPDGTVRTDLDQATWWKDREQIIHLVDDMRPQWRAFSARLLIDQAAYMYRRKRFSEITTSYWSFVHYASEKDWCMTEEEPTSEEIMRTVRKEMDRGAHLDWMRSRPLFLKLIETQIVRDHFNLPGFVGVL
jgi:hypothetical protein